MQIKIDAIVVTQFRPMAPCKGALGSRLEDAVAGANRGDNRFAGFGHSPSPGLRISDSGGRIRCLRKLLIGGCDCRDMVDVVTVCPPGATTCFRGL